MLKLPRAKTQKGFFEREEELFYSFLIMEGRFPVVFVKPTGRSTTGRN
jgi:hypothetical protein